MQTAQKLKWTSILTMAFILTLASCRKDFSNENIAQVSGIKNDLVPTKLGSERANPFSFEIVKKAIEKVRKDKAEARSRAIAANPNLLPPPDDCGGGGGGGTLYPTHTYVRFAPQNVDQLTALEESGMELSDVP